MKKSPLNLTIMAFLATASSAVLATDVTIPNTFTSGTAAVAAEVNDNFTAVKTAVDDNDGRITANATAIGNKLDTSGLGAALDTTTTTTGNSIDGNATAIGNNATAIGNKLNTSGLGAALDTTTTTSGNSIDGNATAIGNNATAIGNKLNTSGLGAALDTTTTTTGNSIDGNAAAIAGKLDTSGLGTALDTATTTAGNSIDDNATAIGDKLDTSGLGTALDTATTTLGNSIDANATDITALESGSGPCPSDMTKVGPICVDIYEASVWSAATAGSQYGDADNSGLVDGSEVAIPCDVNGNDCSVGAANPIYARSVAGVTAAHTISWFQAQQACANVNKRLLTNAEWQMAAAGTPDDGACVTGSRANTGANIVANTGASADCSSNWGAADMVGNVWEWVADWVQGNGGATDSWAPSTGNAGAGFGSDVQSGTNPARDQGTATNMMSAIFRGGQFASGTNAGVFAISTKSAPSETADAIGFRCAR